MNIPEPKQFEGFTYLGRKTWSGKSVENIYDGYLKDGVYYKISLVACDNRPMAIHQYSKRLQEWFLSVFAIKNEDMI